MIENLSNWNPWWATREVPAALKGKQRRLNPLILKVIYEREIIALTGVRRSGKTTIMYQIVALLLEKVKPEQILYLNLDDELLKKESLESLYLFYRQQKNPDKFAYVFFDEIQNIPDWEKMLKKYYDLRDEVKFVISGSSANLLRGEFATLLTGRNFTFTIFPLSFREFLEFDGWEFKESTPRARSKILHALRKYFEYGGFPEVYFKDEALKGVLLKQYFDDIIYKDVIKRHNINAQKITDLAVYLLTNTGTPFTARRIRNFTGLSMDSIREYISYLDDAYLIIIVEHFSYSLKDKSQLPKKSYSLDCGLRNSIGFRFSADIGKLAENCVATELVRRGKKPYYWKGHAEVDFIVKEKDNSLTAINVSFSDRVDEREIRSIVEFRKKFAKAKKLIVLTGDYEGKRQGIIFIPLWKWLVEQD